MTSRTTALDPQNSDFYLLYNTNLLDNLTLTELQTTNRLEEFILRFLQTSIAVILQNYIHQLSDTLIDTMRMYFDFHKASENLNDTQKNNIAYWLKHDFKSRNLLLFVTLNGGCSQSSSFTRTSNNYVTSLNQTGNASTAITAIHQQQFKDWKWINEGTISTLDQRAQNTVDQNKQQIAATTLNVTELSGVLQSTISRQESFRTMLLAYGDKYFHPEPNSLHNFAQLSIISNGLYRFESFDKRPSYFTGTLSGQWSQQNMSPSETPNQLAAQSTDIALTLDMTYQIGKSALVSKTDFSKASLISIYEDSKWQNLSSLLLGKVELSNLDAQWFLGFGLSTAYDVTSSTDLKIHGSSIETSSTFTTDFGPFESETSILASRTYATGSLEGWYFELNKLQESLNYDGIRLYAGLSGYERTLANQNSVFLHQQLISPEFGVSLDLSLGDRVEWKTEGSYGFSKAFGYKPLNENWFAASATVSTLLSNNHAKHSVRLKTIFQFSDHSSSDDFNFRDVQEFSVQTSLVVK